MNCKCGCGEQVKKNNIYIHGHNTRKKNGFKTKKGYMVTHMPNHPYSNAAGNVPISRLVVEKALGKFLDIKHPVHHFNEIKNDNSNVNLVAGENHKYHMLLHQRKRAFDSCGHANYLPCEYCGIYDDPENMTIRKNRRAGYHKKCCADYYREKRLNASN